MDRSQPASVSSFNAATLLLCLSVAGKTRTLLELLSWTYGLYFEAPVRSEDLTAAQTLLGSCDMATVAQSLDASFDEKQDSDRYRRHRGSVATHALQLCIVFRLLLLQRMMQLSTATARIDPYKWLVVQLLLCGYQSPADQRSVTLPLFQLASEVMGHPIVDVLARLDGELALREKVKNQLFNWPLKLVRDLRALQTSSRPGAVCFLHAGSGG